MHQEVLMLITSRILNVNKTSLFDLQFELPISSNILSDVPEHGNILTKISMMYFDDCGFER